METLVNKVRKEMQIYDTKARKKREFIPREKGKVAMYVCGPTVYNKIHIGNARTFLSFDMIRRYFEYRGYEVTFVQNLTDCDDKIINKANEEGCSPEEVTEEFINKFVNDMHDAGVLDPTIRPRATQEIPEMIDITQTLIDKGHAYEVEGDVYFDVSSDKTYGVLSGRDVEDAESGHRTLVADGQGLEKRKRAEADFALWKASKPGEPSWDSPWGKGRPGWHTECVCMSKKYLGLPFDIHGGGSDLIFPHHENEIAQAECAWGQGFANYWMHSGMLKINDEKMSKSLGNFLMLDEVLNQTDARVLRMLTLQTHYRTPLNFSEERLTEAGKALGNIENCIRNLEWLTKNATDGEPTIDGDELVELINKCKDAFISHMDDDFNAPAAVGEIASFSNELNKIFDPNKTISKDDAKAAEKAKDLLIELFGIFGIDLNQNSENNDESVPAEISSICKTIGIEEAGTLDKTLEKIISVRAEARKNKDWDKADKIRDEIASAGWTMEDTAQGTKIYK